MSEKFLVVVSWRDHGSDVVECGSWAAAKSCRNEVWPELRDRLYDVEMFDADGVRLWTSEELEHPITVPQRAGRWQWVEANSESPDVNERFVKVGDAAPLLALWGVGGGSPHDLDPTPVSSKLKERKAAQWRAEGRGF
jgi:hypothetical protein